MLQEKVSAVTDGCGSRVPAAVQPDLLSQEPRLDLSTAPTIPSASEPNQVQRLEMAAYFLHNLFFGRIRAERDSGSGSLSEH